MESDTRGYSKLWPELILVINPAVGFALSDREINKPKSGLLSAEQLHAEQSEDEDEEKEQEQERDDGAHAVEERDDEIPQRWPVSASATHRQTDRQTSVHG